MAIDAVRLVVPMAGIAVCSVLGACQQQDASTYSLYRNSVLNDGARIHVASFNTADGADYNRENCATAANLFGSQPGVRTRFWCEKGQFRP